MKKACPLILVIGFGLLFNCYAGTADQIVAVVGDNIILESELQEALDFVKIQAGPELSLDSNLTQQVLTRLIEDRLILEQAKQETIMVTKSEIESEVDNSLAALVARFPSEDEFQKALAQEGLTEKSLRQRYREEIRKRLSVQKLLAKKGLSNIYIAPAETKKFYQEKKDSIAYVPGMVALAHILFGIKPSPEAEQKSQQRIYEIYDILVRGGDFEVVVGSFSDDQKTKNKGGYLGELKKGELVEEIESVIFSLKPKDISPPVRTMMGYQIFQIISKTKNAIKVNHVLVKVPITGADTLRTKKLAQSVRQELLAGASFDSMVQIYSDDPNTKKEGGYLGEFFIKGLLPPFGPVVEKMQAGAISEPIQSEHGIHLLNVLEKQDERILSYEEMQDKIRGYLYQERLMERLNDYLKKISARIYITKKI